MITINAINEIFNFIMMMYLARKTYIARASVYGIVPQLFVILEGIFTGRMGTHILDAPWYWFYGSWTEIVCFLGSYTLIFTERVRNKNRAKFSKVKVLREEIKYVKELEKR